MLTPRYQTFRESIEDFNAMCEDMDRTQPTEEGRYREAEKLQAQAMEEQKKRQEEVEQFQLTEERRAMEPVRADYAPLSQYRSTEALTRSMRVLAGLEEQVYLPRDPGMCGTTRYTSSIMEQAQPWDDINEDGSLVEDVEE